MFEKLRKDNCKKLDEFKKELDYIQNPRIRMIAEIAICYIHPLFFEKPGSSTGKYHPYTDLGRRGLLRHTRTAVNVAQLLRTINLFELSEHEQDIAIAALILHDSCKYGVHFESEYTVHEHPLLVKELVPNRTFIEEDLDAWNEICDAISTHMGQWTTDKRSTITLPKPKTNIQKFVHEADYLSAKKLFIAQGIWNEEDLSIIEENRKAEEEKQAKEIEAETSKISEAQEKFVKNLILEYRKSCSKLEIEGDKSILKDDLSWLTKKTVRGFIGKTKKAIESNKKLLASKT
jgi:hypothetical protein